MFPINTGVANGQMSRVGSGGMASLPLNNHVTSAGQHPPQQHPQQPPPPQQQQQQHIQPSLNIKMDCEVIHPEYTVGML